MAASAIPSSATPSTSLYRQLGNAHGALVASGMGHRCADDVMRETLTCWMADNAVGSLDGMETEYALLCLAVDEAFARRGFRAHDNKPPQPIPPLPETADLPIDWRVLGFDELIVAIAALLALVLAGGNW